MPAAKKYPAEVKVGSAVVKIYLVRHKMRGTVYQLDWRGADGVRKTPQRREEDEAWKEARLQAGKLAHGQVEATELTAYDRDELVAIRRVCNGTPALTAVNEWAKARELTGGHVLAAAEAFAARNSTKFTHILAEKCVDEFIEAKGGAAERTYRSKLSPIKEFFRARNLDTISTPEWDAYLNQWKNGTSRNDHRRRAITMCIWARKRGYLPRGVDLEVSMTDKVAEALPKIGIVLPETYYRLLVYLRRYHPHYLAAAVLAGVAMRTEEIHGKRSEAEGPRQTWENIHLDKFLLTVTNAKKNTPAWRNIPLSRAAVEWLKVCPKPHTGPVCEPYAIDRIRQIAKSAGLALPSNCFRHSYITFKLATENKKDVADWAGTSVKEIDRHYKRPTMDEGGRKLDMVEKNSPITKKLAREWFFTTPADAEKLNGIVQKTPAENGRAGGLVKSEAKTLAVTANAAVARASRGGAAAADPIV